MKTAIIVTSAVAAGAVGGGATTPTDWVGIATAIGAVGIIVTNILTYLKSARAEKESGEAKVQAVETHAAVNSRMDEFKRLFEESFVARGKLEAQSEAAAAKTAGPLAGKEAIEVTLGSGPGTTEDKPLHTEVRKPKPKK